MNEEKIPCSVGILTFNSGATLARTLESVQDFDDIIICDGGSTDDTLDVARLFGARVIAQSEAFKNADGTLKDYGGARNQCLDTAKHDWFLYVDSDETISEGLREEIRIIANAPVAATSPLVYRVPLCILMDGKRIRYSANYPGYQNRFFNRTSKARFVKAVHERIEFDRAKVITGKTKNPWHTHTTRSEWRNYLKDTAEHRRTQILARCHQPLHDYIFLALGRNFRRSAAVFVKASYNYLVHGFSETLPVAGEWGRALEPLIVAWGITACRFNLPFGLVKRPPKSRKT